MSMSSLYPAELAYRLSQRKAEKVKLLQSMYSAKIGGGMRLNINIIIDRNDCREQLQKEWDRSGIEVGSPANQS